MVAKERLLRLRSVMMVLVLGMTLVGWCAATVGAESAEAPWPPPLHAVYFVDPQNGWVAGDGIIFATRDGGKSWTVQYTGEAKVTQLHFVDALHGWAVSGDALLVTVDGGERWESVALPTADERPPFFSFWATTRVDFWDATRGLLSDGEFLYATEDGGRTWQRLVTPVMAKAACRTGLVEGWVASEEGIYVTQDGGETWTLRFAPDLLEYWWRTDVECIGDRIWVLYRGEVSMSQMAYVVFESPDSGQTWRPALAQAYFSTAYPEIGPVPSIYAQAGAFAAPTEETAYFLGFCAPCDDWTRITFTRDGGSTWRHSVVPNFSFFEASIFFLDEMRGWIAVPEFFTEEGVLLATTDGGQTWRQIRLETSAE